MIDNKTETSEERIPPSAWQDWEGIVSSAHFPSDKEFYKWSEIHDIEPENDDFRHPTADKYYALIRSKKFDEAEKLYQEWKSNNNFSK